MTSSSQPPAFKTTVSTPRKKREKADDGSGTLPDGGMSSSSSSSISGGGSASSGRKKLKISKADQDMSSSNKTGNTTQHKENNLNASLEGTPSARRRDPSPIVAGSQAQHAAASSSFEPSSISANDALSKSLSPLGPRVVADDSVDPKYLSNTGIGAGNSGQKGSSGSAPPGGGQRQVEQSGQGMDYNKNASEVRGGGNGGSSSDELPVNGANSEQADDSERRRIVALLSHRRLLLERLRQCRSSAEDRLKLIASRKHAERRGMEAGYVGANGNDNRKETSSPVVGRQKTFSADSSVNKTSAKGNHIDDVDEVVSKGLREEQDPEEIDEVEEFRKLTRRALHSLKRQKSEGNVGEAEKKSSISLRRGSSVGKRMAAAVTSLTNSGNAGLQASLSDSSASTAGRGQSHGQPLHLAAATPTPAQEIGHAPGVTNVRTTIPGAVPGVQSSVSSANNLESKVQNNVGTEAAMPSAATGVPQGIHSAALRSPASLHSESGLSHPLLTVSTFFTQGRNEPLSNPQHPPEFHLNAASGFTPSSKASKSGIPSLQQSRRSSGTSPSNIQKMKRSGSLKNVNKISAAGMASSAEPCAVSSGPLHSSSTGNIDGVLLGGLSKQTQSLQTDNVRLVVCPEAIALRERRNKLRAKLAVLLHERKKQIDTEIGGSGRAAGGFGREERDHFPSAAASGRSSQSFHPSSATPQVKRPAASAGRPFKSFKSAITCTAIGAPGGKEETSAPTWAAIMAQQRNPCLPVRLPPRRKTHWDYVLEEMRWLATDFVEERKWKLATARTLSCAVRSRGGAAGSPVKALVSPHRSLGDIDVDCDEKKREGISIDGEDQKRRQTGTNASILSAEVRSPLTPRQDRLLHEDPTPVDEKCARTIAKLISVVMSEHWDAVLEGGAYSPSDAAHVAAYRRYCKLRKRYERDELKCLVSSYVGRSVVPDERKNVSTGCEEGTSSDSSITKSGDVSSQIDVEMIDDSVVSSSDDSKFGLVARCAPLNGSVSPKPVSAQTSPQSRSERVFLRGRESLVELSQDAITERIRTSIDRVNERIQNLYGSKWKEKERVQWRKDLAYCGLQLNTEQIDACRFVETVWDVRADNVDSDHLGGKGAVGAVLNGFAGCGKTIAVGATLWRQRMDGPQLLVCQSASLIRWRHELRRFTELNVWTLGLHGGSYDDDSAREGSPFVDTSSYRACDVIICEYSVLSALLKAESFSVRSTESQSSELSLNCVKFDIAMFATITIDTRHPLQGSFYACETASPTQPATPYSSRMKKKLKFPSTQRRYEHPYTKSAPPELISIKWWNNLLKVLYAGNIRRLLVECYGYDWRGGQQQLETGQEDRQSNDLLARKLAFVHHPSIFYSRHSIPSKRVMTWAKRRHHALAKKSANRETGASDMEVENTSKLGLVRGSSGIRGVLQNSIDPFCHDQGQNYVRYFDGSVFSTDNAAPNKGRGAFLGSYGFYPWDIRLCRLGNEQRLAYERCSSHVRGALALSGQGPAARDAKIARLGKKQNKARADRIRRSMLSRAQLEADKMAVKALMRLRRVCIHSHLLHVLSSSNREHFIPFSAEKKKLCHHGTCESSMCLNSSRRRIRGNSSQPDVELARRIIGNSSKLRDLLTILVSECGYRLEGQDALFDALDAERWTQETSMAVARKKVLILAALPEAQLLTSILLNCVGIPHETMLSGRSPSPQRFSSSAQRSEFGSVFGVGSTSLWGSSSALSFVDSARVDDARAVRKRDMIKGMLRHSDAATAWIACQQALARFDSAVEGEPHGCNVIIASPVTIGSANGGLSASSAQLVISLDEDWSGRGNILFESIMINSYTHHFHKWSHYKEARNKIKFIKLVCAETCEETFLLNGHGPAKILSSMSQRVNEESHEMTDISMESPGRDTDKFSDFLGIRNVITDINGFLVEPESSLDSCCFGGKASKSCNVPSFCNTRVLGANVAKLRNEKLSTVLHIHRSMAVDFFTGMDMPFLPTSLGEESRTNKAIMGDTKTRDIVHKEGKNRKDDGQKREDDNIPSLLDDSAADDCFLKRVGRQELDIAFGTALAKAEADAGPIAGLSDFLLSTPIDRYAPATFDTNGPDEGHFSSCFFLVAPPLPPNFPQNTVARRDATAMRSRLYIDNFGKSAFCYGLHSVPSDSTSVLSEHPGEVLLSEVANVSGGVLMGDHDTALAEAWHKSGLSCKANDLAASLLVYTVSCPSDSNHLSSFECSRDTLVQSKGVDLEVSDSAMGWSLESSIQTRDEVLVADEHQPTLRRKRKSRSISHSAGDLEQREEEQFSAGIKFTSAAKRGCHRVNSYSASFSSARNARPMIIRDGNQGCESLVYFPPLFPGMLFGLRQAASDIKDSLQTMKMPISRLDRKTSAVPASTATKRKEPFVYTGNSGKRPRFAATSVFPKNCPGVASPPAPITMPNPQPVPYQHTSSVSAPKGATMMTTSVDLLGIGPVISADVALSASDAVALNASHQDTDNVSSSPDPRAGAQDLTAFNARSNLGVPTKIVTDDESSDNDAASLLRDINEDYGLTGVGALPLAYVSAKVASMTSIETASYSHWYDHLGPCAVDADLLTSFCVCDTEETDAATSTFVGHLFLDSVILFVKKTPQGIGGSGGMGFSASQGLEPGIGGASFPGHSPFDIQTVIAGTPALPTSSIGLPNGSTSISALSHGGEKLAPGVGASSTYRKSMSTKKSKKSQRKQRTTLGASAVSPMSTADFHIYSQQLKHLSGAGFLQVTKVKDPSIRHAQRRPGAAFIFSEAPPLRWAFVQLRHRLSDRVSRAFLPPPSKSRSGPGIPSLLLKESVPAVESLESRYLWTSAVTKLAVSGSKTGDKSRSISASQRATLRRSLVAPCRVDFGPFQIGYLSSPAGMTSISPPRSRVGISLPLGVKVPHHREQQIQNLGRWSAQEDRKLKECITKLGFNWHLASQAVTGINSSNEAASIGLTSSVMIDKNGSEVRSARQCRERWQFLAKNQPSLAKEVRRTERAFREMASMKPRQILRLIRHSPGSASLTEADGLGLPVSFNYPLKRNPCQNSCIVLLPGSLLDEETPSCGGGDKKIEAEIGSAPNQKQVAVTGGAQAIEATTAGANSGVRKRFTFVKAAAHKRQHVPLTIPGVAAGTNPTSIPLVSSHPSHAQSVQSALAAASSGGTGVAPRAEMWPLQLLELADKQRAAAAAAAAAAVQSQTPAPVIARTQHPQHSSSSLPLLGSSSSRHQRSGGVATLPPTSTQPGAPSPQAQPQPPPVSYQMQQHGQLSPSIQPKRQSGAVTAPVSVAPTLQSQQRQQASPVKQQEFASQAARVASMSSSQLTGSQSGAPATVAAVGGGMSNVRHPLQHQQPVGVMHQQSIPSQQHNAVTAISASAKPTYGTSPAPVAQTMLPTVPSTSASPEIKAAALAAALGQPSQQQVSRSHVGIPGHQQPHKPS